MLYYLNLCRCDITSTADLDPVHFPTTVPAVNIHVTDMLREHHMMDAAAKIAVTAYRSILSADVAAAVSVVTDNDLPDQRLHCRSQRIADCEALKAWSKPLAKSQCKALPDLTSDDTIGHAGDVTVDNLWATQPRPTPIELLENALDQRRMNYRYREATRGQRQDINEYAFIDDTSLAFSLKKRQHLAFVLIVKAMLRSWQSRIPDNDSQDQLNADQLKLMAEREQLRMFLTGEGGTGKSRVIDAVEAFCKSWHRPHALAKTAMTGKAAVGIAGRTLHSWLGMHNLESDVTYEAGSAAYRGIPGYTPELTTLIIDEVSMMSKQQLVRLDVACRAATGIDTAFGGLHVVLVGDFFQMPPVGGKSIYLPPDRLLCAKLLIYFYCILG